MEAAEDTSLEPAIAWLVQTILATLLMDKLDAWIRQVGFGEEIERLKSEIRIVGMVVSAVKGRAIGNEPLAQSLAVLKALLYDADDVVDELDYYRLQQQIEGVTIHEPEGMHGAERVYEISSGNAADTPMNCSVGNLRSMVWKHFTITVTENGKPVKSVCKYCGSEFKCKTKNGTSSMNKHIDKICTKIPRAHQPNTSSTGDATEITSNVIGDPSSRKRRRTHEESTQIATTITHIPWDKVELSNNIQKLTSQLQNIQREVSQVLKLYGSGSASSSNHHRSITSDQHLRSSSLVLKKVYGRVAEMDTIRRLITVKKSNGAIVLPIVGIGGVGKTTLVQNVYNDSEVKSKFDHRIWIWVSRNFDEMRIMMEMLDFVPQERHEVPEERHEGISSFAKLQEILTSRANSKRLLLVLDDVWDDTNDRRWIQLLAPIKCNTANGNVIIVTTRKLSVAEMIGTTEPIKLGALETDDFWLLFKSYAFGDENYVGDQNLSEIGQKIAEKLKGNPLAAETTGKLLRKKLNSDHWDKILKNENWKSLQLCGGIMPALKLSYDQLPYHSQQCFKYCSIFPESYQFLVEELAHIWISQGFVKGNPSIKEIEQNYLTNLVNLGFFQQAEREVSSTGCQTCYAVCGLMHDFARIVSLTECATIDGFHCKKMSPTIRHLSIVTDSEYRKDEHGNIPRNEKFEKYLRDTVTSVSKLRTLVLLGHYESFFLKLFEDTFEKAHNLRLLQMSARSADFLKCRSDEVDGALPQVLSNLYHLQVLNVGSYTDRTIPDGINNLVSLRHLVVHKGVYSSIGSMTSFQEPHGFNFQISSGFEMTQLQSTDESVQYWMHVKTLEEAYEAGLRNNELSEKLLLSWEKTSADIGMDLERVEPRHDVKGLEIFGYDASFSLTGIGSTSFQTVHIYGCEEWKILPSLGRFPFLTKLMLNQLEEVKEVLVPSLEELVLFEMPKLERCSCGHVEGMKSRLRALRIENCQALKAFDLFEKDDESEGRQRSWLHGLRDLTLLDCPKLEVSKPLPPSATVSELLVSGVSTLPYMKGASDGTLHIGNLDAYGEMFDESSDELRILDDKILAFHNLRNLKSMTIEGCRNLTTISFKGFSHLVSLKSLKIRLCEKLFSSDVLADVTAANCKAFPSLECLSIEFCGIAGKWLSLLLRHAPGLQELTLEGKMEEGDSSSGDQDDALTESAEDGLVHIPLNLLSSLKKIIIKCCPGLTFIWSEEGFSGFNSLQELTIWECPGLLSSFIMLKDGNDGQAIGRCLLPRSHGISGCSQETLQPCFPRNLTSLKKLEVRWDTGLESLHLHSCTALEELTIEFCGWLTALEGLQSLGSLRHLAVYSCRGLSLLLESLSSQGYELCSRLETLCTEDPSVLTTSLCVGLTSLRRLKLSFLVLTEEPGRALVLLKSLQELEFYSCSRLVDLPAGLHTLPSLKRLKLISCGGLSRLPESGLPHSLEELEIDNCRKIVDLPAGLHLLPSLKRLKLRFCMGISRLPESGLPHSLEELEIDRCRKELTDQCRGLAPSKLRVKIDGEWLVL